MKKGLTRDPPNQLISLQCSLLIPLKTSENLWFSDVFRGIKSEHWEEMGLRLSNATWSEIAKKNGAWAGTAMRFLNLLIRLAVEFFWIYSIKKVYSICYIPSQIQYWKNLVPCWTKCSQPISEIFWYFCTLIKFRKAKSFFSDFCEGLVKNGHRSLGHWTLKSGKFQEWIDKLN